MVRFDEILDDVFSAAKTVVNVASKKTTELVGMGKLTFQKQSLARDIAKAYAKLGAVTYDAKVGGGNMDGLVDSAVEEITNLNNQLDVVEKEMEEAKVEFSSYGEKKDDGAAEKISVDIEEEFSNVVDVTDKINAKVEEVSDEVEKLDDVMAPFSSDGDKE